MIYCWKNEYTQLPLQRDGQLTHFGFFQKMFAFLIPIVLAWAGITQAAEVSLTPISDVSSVKAGDHIELNIHIDFADVGGALGGGFDLVFDSSALTLAGLTDNAPGDPDFSRLPDERGGRLESWSYGAWQGFPGKVILGTVTFEVLPTIMSQTTIQLQETSGVGGPWVSLQDNVSLIQPNYGSVVVDSVIVFSDGFEAR